MKDKILETQWGVINYNYYKDEKYPNGLLIFMGSYIPRKFRGQGKFKEMVNELFSQFQKGTEVQLAIANKHLIHMFEEMGFEKTEDIEYWGSPSNTINLKGKI
jgi:predicted GNAT family N-acyltransferase